MLIPILLTAILMQQQESQARPATVINLKVDFENGPTGILLENCLINQLQNIRGVAVRSSSADPDFEVIITGVVNTSRGLIASSLYAGMPLGKMPAFANIAKNGEPRWQISGRLYVGVQTAATGDTEGLCGMIVADINKHVIQRFAPPPPLP